MHQPYALLLFGGDLDVVMPPVKRTRNGEQQFDPSKAQQSMVTVDHWIKFNAPPVIAAYIRALRELLDEHLNLKIRQPSLDISESAIVVALVDLLDSGHGL